MIRKVRINVCPQCRKFKVKRFGDQDQEFISSAVP